MPKTKPARDLSPGDLVRVYGLTYRVDEVEPFGHRTQIVLDSGACFTLNNRDHVLLASRT